MFCTGSLLRFLTYMVLVVSVGQACSRKNDSGFSNKKMTGLQQQTEEVFVNRHVKFNDLPEWAKETGRFYSSRNYRTAWFNGISMNDAGKELIEELKSSWKEAVPEPVVYLAKVEDAMLKIQKHSAGKVSLAEIISFADVYLTQAYFDLASKISSGMLNPAELNIIWEILPDSIDIVSNLEDALARGNISRLFEKLRPQYQQYNLLLKSFIKLLDVQASGGWSLPGFFLPLKRGDTDINVVRVKEFLFSTGDVKENDTTWIRSPEFDTRLSEAVKNFQYRHGLKQDGIVGETTLKQMNVPLEYRLDQIRLNIDRIRWLPKNFGNHYIVINIPDFSFQYYKNEKQVQEMNVVVGKNENYTPVLEDTLHSVIFNPTWNVPNSIATLEIFPKMLKDSSFMERNQYSILLDSYISKDTIDYKTFDWSEVSRDSFPFFIVQHPGPLNSLGRIQFLLQNQYSIFLHDTPASHLFSIQQRDFSHGCIRLERPAELAVSLLKNQLPSDSIIKYLSETEKKAVRLEEKIPVHLIYQTAWADENEVLHFRDDIYGFDELSMPYFQRNFPPMAFLKNEKN